MLLKNICHLNGPDLYWWTIHRSSGTQTQTSGKAKSRLEKVLVLMRINSDKSNAGAIVWTVTIEACSNGGMNHFGWHTGRISRTWLGILRQRLEPLIEKFVGFFTRIQPCWSTPTITRFPLAMSLGCCGKKILHHDGATDIFFLHVYKGTLEECFQQGFVNFFLIFSFTHRSTSCHWHPSIVTHTRTLTTGSHY